MRQPTSSGYRPLGSTDSSEGGAESEWLGNGAPSSVPGDLQAKIAAQFTQVGAIWRKYCFPSAGHASPHATTSSTVFNRYAELIPPPPRPLHLKRTSMNHLRRRRAGRASPPATTSSTVFRRYAELRPSSPPPPPSAVRTKYLAVWLARLSMATGGWQLHGRAREKER
ncbi:unnamed protein product [Closterium sp. NIES-53]